MTEQWYGERCGEGVRLCVETDRLVHREQTPFRMMEFLHSDAFGMLLVLDGRLAVTESDGFCRHEMMVHPAFAVSPFIRRALVIGGCDGGAVREICRYKAVKRIDVAEPDSRAVELCGEHLPGAARAMEDPRVQLYSVSGGELVACAEDKSYELILVDAGDPGDAGDELFSPEFYEGCKRALVGDGILVTRLGCAYCPGQEERMAKAYRALSGVFPLAQAYGVQLPTAPGGSLLLGFASRGLHPVQDLNMRSWDSLGLETRYYNTELHRFAFSLPGCVRRLLENGEKPFGKSV